MPTSIRPPEMRSSVASALASTDAGRSASQNTSVPSRMWSSSRASAASVTIGSNAASGRSLPPYFAMSRKRWSESQTRVEAELLGGAGACRARSTT